MEKIIEGTNGKYVITTEGKVFNLKYYGRNERREVATFLSHNGYVKVRLTVDVNKQQNYRVNRLVAEAFIPNPDGLPFVGHKDDNPLNNDVSNLYWTDYKENNAKLEHRKNISKAQAGQPKKFCGVYQIDTTTGEVIQYFKSIKLAAETLGTSRRNITNAAQGKQNTAAGFAWAYADNQPI